MRTRMSDPPSTDPFQNIYKQVSETRRTGSLGHRWSSVQCKMIRYVFSFLCLFENAVILLKQNALTTIYKGFWTESSQPNITAACHWRLLPHPSRFMLHNHHSFRAASLNQKIKLRGMKRQNHSSVWIRCKVRKEVEKEMTRPIIWTIQVAL
jgi:hypothetical protein